MKIVGFNFTKISVEKMKDSTQNISIKTNIDIKDIREVKTDLLKSEESLIGINFEITLDYEPEFAKLSFRGGTVLSLDKETATKVIEKWEGKEVLEEFRLDLFNFLMRKVNVRALPLEDELNLPYHIPFPKLQNTSSEPKEE